MNSSPLLALLPATAMQSFHAIAAPTVVEENFTSPLSPEWFWGPGNWTAKDGVLRGFESGPLRQGPVKMHSRANREIGREGQMPLPSRTLTVAQLLKSAVYATACIGKWAMGIFDTAGSPLKLGFAYGTLSIRNVSTTTP